MAVFLSTGPVAKAEAQAVLKCRVSSRLEEVGTEELRDRAAREMQWISDRDIGNLYLLLQSWVNVLKQNQLTWWVEMPETPVVGWLLGIRQTLPISDSFVQTSADKRKITFIASSIGERLLLASMLQQSGQIVDPGRYVIIRWHCIWTGFSQAAEDSSQVDLLDEKIFCDFFRFDGLSQLEKLEYATNVRRRERNIEKSELEEALMAKFAVADSSRREMLYYLTLFWKEFGLPEPQFVSDRASIAQIMSISESLPSYFETLAVANVVFGSLQGGGDPYKFLLDSADKKTVTYMPPKADAISDERCRRLDKRKLLKQGLSENDLKWMEGIHCLYSPAYLRGVWEILLRTDYYRRHHLTEWRRVMENKGLEHVSEKMKTALELIESSWMKQEDYQRRVAVGELADYEKLVHNLGDRKFEQLHPEHPLADKNRYLRIGAADCIRDIAAKRLTPFPDAVLDKICELLFDCSGSVRHSLAAALYHAGDHSSAKVLRELVQTEQDSAMVRETVEVAALRCGQRGLGCKQVPLDPPAVSLVSADVNLAIELNRLAKERGFHLLFPEPEISDLFVFPAKVRIVNRRALGITAWNYFLGFLEEGNRPLSEAAKKELAADGIDCDDYEMDEPPLILIDGFSQEEDEAWGLLPEMGLEVNRAEEWMCDWILAKVVEILGRGEVC